MPDLTAPRVAPNVASSRQETAPQLAQGSTAASKIKAFLMTFFSTLPTEVLDAIGVAGFGLYVLNYSLLTFRRIGSDQARYFVINLAAATMVMIGLTTAFNLAAALIQGFWIVISIVAIVMRQRRSGRRGHTPPQVATLIEFPTELRSAAPRPHDQHSPDVFLETDYRDRGYERRTLHRATG